MSSEDEQSNDPLPRRKWRFPTTPPPITFHGFLGSPIPFGSPKYIKLLRKHFEEAVKRYREKECAMDVGELWRKWCREEDLL